MLKKRKSFLEAICFLGAFALWTAAVCLMDVGAIGPMGSAVGFSALNGFVHELTGVHMWLYAATDWLSLAPAGLVVGFALLGLRQWMERKSLLKVDRSILVLGGFYLAVLAVYVLFELCVVNARPVLIGGQLEPSYPSSTTVLVLCVMCTAVMQLKERVESKCIKRLVLCAITVFAVMMVAFRLVSGVHWFTDIVGGVLLSAGLVKLYDSFA